MDPLSLTASVIACIQLSGKLFEYLGPSKRSVKDLERLHQSIFAFHNICQQLKLHLEYSEEDEIRLSALQHLQQPLGESARTLERIEKRLSNVKFLGKYLIGNTGEEDLKKCLQRLDDAKRVFELALHADHHTILTAIERYVRNVAEDVNDTRSIVNENGKRILKIQDELDMQEKISRIRHDDVKKKIHQAYMGNVV